MKRAETKNKSTYDVILNLNLVLERKKKKAHYIEFIGKIGIWTILKVKMFYSVSGWDLWKQMLRQIEYLRGMQSTR